MVSPDPNAAAPEPFDRNGIDRGRLTVAATGRADLMEAVFADLNGPARLVADGVLPAGAVTGSAAFHPPILGLSAAGGRHLHLVAIDVAGPPGGDDWRIVAVHPRLPPGLGAVADQPDGGRLLAAFRENWAARSGGASATLALLAPPPGDPRRAEAEALAAALGLIVVEGDDLVANARGVELRLFGARRRIDGLWCWPEARLLDPLALDSRSTIGVAGLVDAVAAGRVVLAEASGADLIAEPVFAAFWPRLATAHGAPAPPLGDCETWWPGDPGAPRTPPPGEWRFAPAFRGRDGGDPIDLLTRRPHAVIGIRPAPPGTITMRLFLARGADGGWRMAAGEAGDGEDDGAPGHTRSPLPQAAFGAPDLFARVADDLFWRGRYRERRRILCAAATWFDAPSAGGDGAGIASLLGLDAPTATAASAAADALAIRIEGLTRAIGDGAVPPPGRRLQDLGHRLERALLLARAGIADGTDAVAPLIGAADLDGEMAAIADDLAALPGGVTWPPGDAAAVLAGLSDRLAAAWFGRMPS